MTILRPIPIAALVCTVATPAWGEDAFAIEDRPAEGHLDFLHLGKTVGRYMYGRDVSTPDASFDTAKTFLHVFDPAGEKPITKGAGGSFPHHRGIFLGWNKLQVDGKSQDLWHVKGTEQVHRGFVDEKSDADGAGVTSVVEWKGKAGEVLVEEKRRMHFREAPAPAYALVDFSSTLTAVAGEVKLDGDPEHAGLQFRPANEVDAKKTRYLFPREKADPTKDEDYPWVLESFSLEGEMYHVAFLNHPENPKGTRFSAYRDYGRFGGFYRATIPKGGTLELNVRFLILKGELPSAEWIQNQSNTFTGQSLPTPVTTLK